MIEDTMSEDNHAPRFHDFNCFVHVKRVLDPCQNQTLCKGASGNATNTTQPITRRLRNDTLDAMAALLDLGVNVKAFLPPSGLCNLSPMIGSIGSPRITIKSIISMCFTVNKSSDHSLHAIHTVLMAGISRARTSGAPYGPQCALQNDQDTNDQLVSSVLLVISVFVCSLLE
jgi:hypothetical protein